MRVHALLFLGALVVAHAVPLAAQEPQPALIGATSLNDPQGAALTLAWRFAPGDAPGRESPRLDDSHWRLVRPQMIDGDLGPTGWPGVGWFRRHLLIDPSLQQRTLVLRFKSPGAAEVYLDGRLVLSFDRTSGTPEIPSDRRDATMVQMKGSSHLIAVRYVYPLQAPRPAEGIGYELNLAKPGIAEAGHSWIDVLQGNVVQSGSWVLAIQGAILALPIFLALLHLALFAFDPRARENLFYAGEVIAFEAILVHDFGSAFVPSEALRSEIARGGPAAAILFGTLTFYAVRTKPYPRTWPAFVVAGMAAFAASYLLPNDQQPIWILYFCFMIAEVLRLELRGRTARRDAATNFFLSSFAIFCITVILQILVNYDLLESVAGLREVYLFGILVSAVGMSLYLAQRMGRSRVLEAENKRKSDELAQARTLQLSMLPRTLPDVHGLEIAPMTQTAAEVGGDYYDVRADGNGGLLFAFGDATGHGLAAGIVVTAAKALFNSLPADGSPRDLLETCDRTLRAMQLPSLRMCLALARITPTEAVAASAAMPPILVHRVATGSVEELGAGALPLGSRIVSRYENRRTALHAGDTLLFASDGFAELLDPVGRALGYDAVSAAFRDAAAAQSAREVIDRLDAIATKFRGVRPLADDITLLVVRVRALTPLDDSFSAATYHATKAMANIPAIR